MIVDVNLNHAGGPDVDPNVSAEVAGFYPFNSTEHCSLMKNEGHD